MEFVPRKLYYKIGEVCGIVGVPAHVLRYWESEFPALTPPKNKGGQRTYRPIDIELLLQIRKLLYEDGFTIAGARRQLMGGRSKNRLEPAGRGSGEAPAGKRVKKEDLSKVREELQNILTLLDREC